MNTHSKPHPSRLLPIALAILFCFALLPRASAQAAGGKGGQWSTPTVESFSTLPVQDRGRVKPVDSLAGLKLLTLNGKRTLKLADGEKLKSTAWLLDCLFFPEVARTQPCFRVQNDAVLTAVGLESKAKRAWYSYAELFPGRDRILSLASRHSRIDTAQQTATQRQVIKLAMDLREFEGLTGSLAGLRDTFSAGESPELAELLGGPTATSFTDILRRAPALKLLSTRLSAQGGAGDAAVSEFFGRLNHAIDDASGGLALFPPPPGADEPLTWWGISDLVMAAFQSDLDLGPQLALLASLEGMAEARADAPAFEHHLAAFHGRAVALTEARDEYGHIPLEVKMNRWDLFTNALVLFLLGFLLMGASWLMPKVRWLWGAVWASVSVATLLVAIGVTMRCIIRQRPPVVSLYDTILFITGCMVIVGLALEWFTRLRVVIALSTILGAAGMFLAGRYELKEVASAGDTMASVVAVLDTNYYLAIHVTTIAMGYAGGLLAGAIAHIWILGKLIGWRRNDFVFYRTISRMTYGVLCFSLVFAIFGTIMGGIWANDSWGRFWGWDPKENGALLICIWQLFIIHARLGGYIRERGLAVLSVLGCIVVSASWWGVNLLNVGLHSYGFTSGVMMTLGLVWALELLVVALAGVGALVERGGTNLPPPGGDPLEGSAA